MVKANRDIKRQAREVERKQELERARRATEKQKQGFDAQLQKLARVNKALSQQLQVRDAVLLRVLNGIEGLCKLMRNALLHRTCPACSGYPCEGTSAQCNVEMYAAHRGQTVEQVATAGQRVAAGNAAAVPLDKPPAEAKPDA